MIPARIAQKLLNGVTVEPEKHQFVAIFKSDIKGFSTYVDGRDPLNVFFSLDRIFSVMDMCVSQFPELYKVETSADGYMVVGLADNGSHSSVVHAITTFALMVLDYYRTIIIIISIS